MKIQTFLKGSTMRFIFNEAQLSRPQLESLRKVCDVLQLENENELEVTVVEFPEKFKVTLDDDVEMLLGWSYEDDSYSGLTTPERLESDIKDLAKETVDLPGSVEDEQESKPFLCLDMSGNIIPGSMVGDSDIDSEIGQRVQALARALVNLSKPLDTDRRCKVWIDFTSIFIKELLG